MKQHASEPQLKLRINPELKSWLQMQAQSEHRSLNAQVTFILLQVQMGRMTMKS